MAAFYEEIKAASGAYKYYVSAPRTPAARWREWGSGFYRIPPPLLSLV